MQAIYNLKESELDIKLLRAIKAAFKGMHLEISVKATSGAFISAQEVLEAKIVRGEQAEYEFVLSAAELKSFIEKSMVGEPTDESQYKRSVNKFSEARP